MSAAAALASIRREVKEATGQDLYLVAFIFNFRENQALVTDVGFDALSTYATAMGSEGRSIPYSQCSAIARRDWSIGSQGSGGFLPTITMGWDYRPALRDPGERIARKPNPDWCQPASDEEWKRQIQAGVRAAVSNSRNERFKSVVIYAWNEGSEGGWLLPTVGEGTRRIQVVSDGLGRHRHIAPFHLSWRIHVDPIACKIPPFWTPIELIGLGCNIQSGARTNSWPCPPRMRVADDNFKQSFSDANGEDPSIWRQITCASIN